MNVGEQTISTILQIRSQCKQIYKIHPVGKKNPEHYRLSFEEWKSIFNNFWYKYF